MLVQPSGKLRSGILGLDLAQLTGEADSTWQAEALPNGQFKVVILNEEAVTQLASTLEDLYFNEVLIRYKVFSPFGNRSTQELSNPEAFNCIGPSA